MSDRLDDYLKQQEKGDVKDTPLMRSINLIKDDQNLNGLFRFNRFNKSIEFNKQPIWNKYSKSGQEFSDHDLIELRSIMTIKWGFSPSKENLMDAVLYIARRNQFHPIEEYLLGLEWDSKDRLDLWLHWVTGCKDNVYTRAVSRKILIAAVARILQPGCKFDCLAILEGRQGMKKSMLIETLAGEGFFSTIDFKMSNKEIVEIMRGKWFMEIAEMHGFNKQAVEKVKNILSTRVARCRLSYGRLAQDFQRHSVFIGTMNPEGQNTYLTDTSGNRRFWPILCRENIKIDLLKEMRDQLFAEALYKFMRNEPLWLDDRESFEASVIEQEERTVIDPWELEIDTWIKEEMKKPGFEITINQIMADCLKIPVERMSKSYQIRIGKIISKYGLIKKRKNTGMRENYYVKNEDEVVDWSENVKPASV